MGKAAYDMIGSAVGCVSGRLQFSQHRETVDDAPPGLIRHMLKYRFGEEIRTV